MQTIMIDMTRCMLLFGESIQPILATLDKGERAYATYEDDDSDVYEIIKRSSDQYEVGFFSNLDGPFSNILNG